MFKKRILLTVPNTGNIRAELVEALFKIKLDNRYDVNMWYPNKKPLENNQHHIINELIKNKENPYHFWLNIDSDTVPLNNPLDLVELNRDIIGLPYPIWHANNKGERPYYWAAYDYDKKSGDYLEHKEKEGLQQVDAIGGGCFLISSRVFLQKEMQKGAFVRKLNDDGTVKRGNDLSFCERAKLNKFEIFSHFDFPCKHYKNIDMISIINGFENING